MAELELGAVLEETSALTATLDAVVQFGVTSVNGKTGVVVLDASDVGAAAAVHTHDDRYYTETETDTLLAGKATSVHTHAQSDVTGLTSALSGKIGEPADEGTDGQVLTTDGNGGRSWSTVQGGVTSVNGETGAVVLDADDVGAAAAVHAHAQSDVTGLTAALGSKEESSNKVTSVSSQSTDAQYPSAKCVYDILGNVESLLAAL